MEFDLDCNPIDPARAADVFRAADPWRDLSGASRRHLRRAQSRLRGYSIRIDAKAAASACVHPACGIGTHVPVWDSRTSFGDTDLLITNMERGRDLARGHGQAQFGAAARPWLRRGRTRSQGRPCSTPSTSRSTPAWCCNRCLSATTSRYLSEGEIELTKKLVYAENSVTRMWDYWSLRCGDKSASALAK